MTTPPPITSDADAVARMRVLARRLRELNCRESELPPEVIAESNLLRAYVRRRVSREVAAVDQQAAAVLDAIDTTTTAG